MRDGQPSNDELWAAVDTILDRSSAAGSLHHGLGALDAKRRRALGREIPSATEREERSAAIFAAVAAPLLERIRGACDGALVIFKGPEIAAGYRAGGRAFSDIDLLTPFPDSIRRSLLAAGFVEDERGLEATHHSKPLLWEALPLKVEIHGELKWPGGRRSPPAAEIVEASLPSATGIDGLRAPSTTHHALMIAAHSWDHLPLRIVRDLLDIAVLAPDSDETRGLASAWGLRKVWNATQGAVEGMFFGGARTAPMRSWARHLEGVRERTVVESHLEHWLSPFWDLPAPAALVNTGRVLRSEVRPLPGETWADKLKRSGAAARHALLPVAAHDALLDPPPEAPDDSN